MIKVASYNIHKAVGIDRVRNPERILAVLREIDADVIALQEADRRFGQRTALLPAHHLADKSPWKTIPLGARPQSSGWHGNVILVRKEAEVTHCEQLHLPTLEPRGAVMADVRLGKEHIRVVGMHLDLSGLMRRRQAAAIIEELDGHHHIPTVLMGDLNEWSRQSGCLKEFGNYFRFAATGPSFHTRRPVGKLDRIMTSADLRFTGCGVHLSAESRMASDHLPIWATVERA